MIQITLDWITKNSETLANAMMLHPGLSCLVMVALMIFVVVFVVAVTVLVRARNEGEGRR